MGRCERLVAGTVLVSATLAGAAWAATPAQIVAKLNAQRVANGIPGGIVLDAAWTRGCQHHVRYEELNGIGWTHDEVAGKPGYTKDGRLAGLEGDQANTGSYDGGNPYENLPLHLAGQLDPALARVGAYESGRRTCVSLASGWTRQFASNALYTYPGGARSGVPASQTVHGESPLAPGDVVGLPQGTKTGPTIYVFAVGPWLADPALRLRAAHLTGPHGRVALRLVDPAVRSALKGHLRPGIFFVIPVSPLGRGSRYTASVTVTARHGLAMTRTWRFVTAG